MEELTLPEFLLAEFPIKNESFNDQCIFIVHKGLSLIEVIVHDETPAFVTFHSKISRQYSYFGEEFTLVYHTCNVQFHHLEPKELLDKAWEWFREYLIWEDTQ